VIISKLKGIAIASKIASNAAISDINPVAGE